MVKIIKECWEKNQDLLRETIEGLEAIRELDYLDIVKMAFGCIFHDASGLDDPYDLENIHAIDDGNYQGTIMFLIPADAYQPGPSDYILTYVYYGSCSYCDALQGIIAHENREQQNASLFQLCKDILCNAIKPYNSNWRHDPKWEEVEMTD